MLEQEDGQYVEDLVYIDRAVRSIEERRQFEFLATVLGVKRVT